MRTLSRPMFNMGGPIKQGIMNGIREPKRDGGKMLLVGQHPKEFRDKSGREKHLAPLLAIPAWQAARMATMRAAPSIYRGIANIFRGTRAGQVTGGGGLKTAGEYARTQMAPLSRLEKIKSWFGSAPAGKWLGQDPAIKAGISGSGYLGTPLRKAKDIAKWGLTTPSGLVTSGLTAKFFWPDGTKKTKEELVAQGPPGGGDPGMTYTKPGPTPKSQAEKDAFAKSQREKRVNKYLDMMGYDRSKKLAIADALIDASKIVGERGTLDPKNITQELISPIIQATSKRLDKPEQIREAVGLMTMKAEIEKDLSKETDALKTKALELQIQGAEQTLAKSASFEAGMMEFLSARKDKVNKQTLEQFARLLADKHGDSFTVIEDVTAIPEGGSGIYMSGGDIYRVTEGNAQQIV
jgi:hypothetical protein